VHKIDVATSKINSNMFITNIAMPKEMPRQVYILCVTFIEKDDLPEENKSKVIIEHYVHPEHKLMLYT
jgi:hypothetical protein